MQKNILILILVSRLFLIGLAQTAYIPDPIFRNTLLTSKCADYEGDFNYDGDADLNNDGLLQISELQSIRRLTLENKVVVDLTGIKEFTILSDLYMPGIDTRNIDLSNMKSLSYVAAHTGVVESIDVSGCDNLKSLYVYANKIKSLDLHDLPKLEIVGCYQNGMTNLNVSGCLSLKQLDCYENKLSTLDLIDKPNIETIKAANNVLKSIHINQCNKLRRLSIEGNEISTITLSDAPAMVYLHAGVNKISSFNHGVLSALETVLLNGSLIDTLDVTTMKKIKSMNLIGSKIVHLKNQQNLVSLTSLIWHSALIKEMDFSKSPLLKEIDINFAKTEILNLNNGSLETTINIKNCLNLKYICADPNQVNAIKKNLIANNLTADVNSYCVYKEGEQFYDLAGKCSFDFLRNGCSGGDDYDIPYPQIKISGSVEGLIYGQKDGSFSTPVQQGNYTMSFGVNPSLFTVSPVSVVHNITDTSPDSTYNEFCIKNYFASPNFDRLDLELYALPLNTPRPGNVFRMLLIVKNTANKKPNVSLEITYLSKYISLKNILLDDTLLGSAYYTQSNDNLNINSGEVGPFDIKIYELQFLLNKPTDNFPLVGGEYLEFNGLVTPVVGDINESNNYLQASYRVLNSLDPNDITCLEGDSLKVKNGQYTLHYLINFENIGSASAEHIFVQNQIDTSKLDINSFKIVHASHPCKVFTFEKNRKEFHFENIYLATPGSTESNKGFLMYEIKSKGIIGAGTTISNQASIFFDFNLPIHTNTSNVLFYDITASEDLNDALVFYPNPAFDKIFTSLGDNISFRIFDINGRDVTGNILIKNNYMDISVLDNGYYVIKIRLGSKFVTKGFIKL